MKVDFAKLQEQYVHHKEEIDGAIQAVLDKSNYIMGEEVRWLESSLQKFTQAKHAIVCSSGTDALLLAMMAVGIKADDEVITTTFSFIATAETVAFLGAKPVFVDIDEKTYNIDTSKIEAAVTSKTKAILAVSLFGQPADMDVILDIAKRYKLKVIIDGAQSFGSTYKGKRDSNIGDISITSFFPAKPLGCYGDGGALFTNSDQLAEKIRSLRLHGQSKRYYHKYIGISGRMDTIQAAILNVKLKYYANDLKLRQNAAIKYTALLDDKNIILPKVDENSSCVWAQYSIRVENRDKIQKELKEAGISFAVHYPLPMHLQDSFRYLGYKVGDFPISERVSKDIISLPMNPYLTQSELEYVASNLNKFASDNKRV